MDLEGINTGFLGQKIQCFETITSTQEYVKEKYSNLEEGEIIFAERQISGIGTHQRKWFTGKKDNKNYCTKFSTSYKRTIFDYTWNKRT